MLNNGLATSNMAAYSHIISPKDLECNNVLVGSDTKDFVLSYSFPRKFWLSLRKDRWIIITGLLLQGSESLQLFSKGFTIKSCKLLNTPVRPKE